MLASLPHRAWWLLALLAACAWFATLGARALQHPDEGRYAEIAREMAVNGNWVTPRLNDLKYFEKPPLQYWLGAATFLAFGVTEWTARLPAALAGFLAVLVVGFAAWRLAGREAGAYAALVLLGCVWHAGMAHYLTLDATLTFWLTFALCAFLLAQRDGLAFRVQRNFMLLAYAATAAATLTKGLVALVLPAAVLVLYSLVTRDTGPWRRLHAAPGVALYLLLTVPWFLLVSTANPEFARFFFVHEHLERFLTTTHRRGGPWHFFVPWFVVGIFPWLLIWAWTLPRSWRRAEVADNGFAWARFCLVWAAFVFVFFSLSGSKLASYILPMFPALALVLGHELTRLSSRALMWMALPLATSATLLLIGHRPGYAWLASRIADDHTPVSIYAALEPWVTAAIFTVAASSTLAFLLFRRGTPAAKTWGIVAMSLLSLGGLQIAFQGHDAFRLVRSAHDILRAAERAYGGALDPAYPFYQVASYDQTLPFYLERPTTLVAFRDEMALGLDAEPHKGYQKDAWRPLWQNAPQAYALMDHATAAHLSAEGLPMRELARDPRRVLVARR